MFKFTNVDSQIGEIGYRLNTSYQSQGYAIEANTAFIEYIFSQLGAHKISALCLTENNASWGLMIKLGMHREGILKSHFKLDKQWHDAYMYSIINEI